MFIRLMFLLVTSFSGFLTSHVLAAEPALDFDPRLSLAAIGSEPEMAQASADAFAQGVWTFQLSGAFLYGEERGSAYIGQVAVGHFILPALSFNLQGNFGHLDAKQSTVDDGHLLGFDLLLRWHLLHHDAWSFFIDGGVGMIWFDDDFPSGGTQQNFTPQLGLGVTAPLGDRLQLIAGIRWQHISNARKSGRDRNPGFDGVTAYTGIVIPF